MKKEVYNEVKEFGVDTLETLTRRLKVAKMVSDQLIDSLPSAIKEEVTETKDESEDRTTNEDLTLETIIQMYKDIDAIVTKCNLSDLSIEKYFDMDTYGAIRKCATLIKPAGVPRRIRDIMSMASAVYASGTTYADLTTKIDTCKSFVASMDWFFGIVTVNDIQYKIPEDLINLTNACVRFLCGIESVIAGQAAMYEVLDFNSEKLSKVDVSSKDKTAVQYIKEVLDAAGTYNQRVAFRKLYGLPIDTSENSVIMSQLAGKIKDRIGRSTKPANNTPGENLLQAIRESSEINTEAESLHQYAILHRKLNRLRDLLKLDEYEGRSYEEDVDIFFKACEKLKFTNISAYTWCRQAQPSSVELFLNHLVCLLMSSAPKTDVKTEKTETVAKDDIVCLLMSTAPKNDVKTVKTETVAKDDNTQACVDIINGIGEKYFSNTNNPEAWRDLDDDAVKDIIKTLATGIQKLANKD